MAAREVAVAAIGTVYAIDDTEHEGGQKAMTEAEAQLVAAHRARLPDVVRLRAPVHFDHRGDAKRNQWLEVARLHGGVLVHHRLCDGRHHILAGRFAGL
jgi:hypothetical protein